MLWSRHRTFVWLLGALFLGSAGLARGQTPMRVVPTNLRPLIQAAAASPTQFAVNIANEASTESAGNWVTKGDRAIWSYGVRVPTAVSLSFHAQKVRLPASAVLTVQGTTTVVTYRGKDVHRSELWSRVQPGDTLELSLSVAAADRNAVQLDIISLQAGYRSIGAGVEDHPYYRQLRQLRQLVGSGTSSCVQNYECSVTQANRPGGQATVGLVIDNLYQCTGTLLNDVPQDETPYVLTARHCESGQLGGGDPGAAAGVTVYWDAISACGATLGSLYDPGVSTQTGASTVVEQQDAWLIRLDESPVVSDAQFAGLDATGGTVTGGYTIHHALGYNKQYATWFGNAYALQDTGTLGVNYVSNFLETVNASGNIGPGASGSALFNQGDTLVGSLTLGRGTADSSGYEACPVANPSAPNGSNGAADFTDLSAVWSSTADSTSSTGSASLQSVLDPQHAGALVVGTMPAASMSFTSSTYSLALGSVATLTWNAPGASQCVASQGSTGDGWGGGLPSSGSQQITETTASAVDYYISCQLTATRSVTAMVSVTWGNPSPHVLLGGSSAAWTNAPATLIWNSNVAPCAITGGSLLTSGLPSSGSLTTTQASSGDVQYKIACGPNGSQAVNYKGVTYVTPSLQLSANSTDRQLGQPFSLQWMTAATTCTPSGGAPNDGWTSTSFTGSLVEESSSPHVSAAGTYTYTLTCSGGSTTLSQSVTVTFENAAGYATLNAQPTTVTYLDSPADDVTLNWLTNLDSCYINSQPFAGITVTNDNPEGSAIWEAGPGTYTVTVTCMPFDTAVGEVTSAPVTITVLTPPPATATMSVTPQNATVGQSIVVSWNSTYAPTCLGTGTAPPDWNWVSLDSALGPSGSFTVVASAAIVGQWKFGVNCGSLVSSLPPATAQSTLTVSPAGPTTAAISVSPTSGPVGQLFNVSWSSKNAAGCTAGGGGADGTTWSGPLPANGAEGIVSTTVGAFSYTVTCTEGNQSAEASATMNVSNASSPSGTESQSGGKGGGGGAASPLEILALAGVWWLRRRSVALGGKRND